MKNILKWTGVLLMILIVSCSKDEDKNGGFAPVFTPGEATEITRTSVHLSGEVVYAENMAFECGFMYSTAASVPTKDAIRAKGTIEEGYLCKATLTGLKPNTTYYYCMYASNGSSLVRGDKIKQFATLADGVPKMDATTLEGVGERSITVSSRILDNGGSDIQSCGFGYRVMDEEIKYTYVDAEAYTNEAKMEYRLTIKNLTPETRYQLLAYAINSKGRGEGEVMVITTTSLQSPTVSTQDVANITATSAVVAGTLEDPGKGTVTERGFMISEKGSTEVPTKVVATSPQEEKTFTQIIPGLKPNTTYVVYAYAQSTLESETLIGQGYTKEFKTLERTVPSLSMASCSEIDKINNSMTVTAKITNDGNGTISGVGFYYSMTNKNPTAADSPLPCEVKEDNTITGVISGLLKNKTYYVRAYAVNEEGEGVGGVIEVLPLPVGALSFGEVTYSLKDNALTLISSITNTGEGTVTERGFLWSTTTNVPTDMDKLVATGDNKAFTATLPAVKKDTPYYIRAYAVNERGQTNGELLEVTPIKVDVPAINTVKATLEGTALALESSVASANNGTVSERGFVWSFDSSKQPFEMENTLAATGDDSKFIAKLAGVEPNKTYYICAYAVNEKGKGYGAKISSTPWSVTQPQVSNVECTLKDGIATIKSCVISTGNGTISKRGFLWSTTQSSPEQMENDLVASGNDDEFTATIPNVAIGQEYYIYAYAVNEIGTAYSRVWHDKLWKVTVPTLSDVEYEVNGTTLTIKSKVLSTGNGTITERGFYWNQVSSSITGNQLLATSGDNDGFTATMEIEPNKNYYIYAYAVNQAGTGKSNVKSGVLLRVYPPNVGPTTGKIQGRSVVLSSYVSSEAELTQVGFYYSINGSPTTESKFLAAPMGEIFEATLENLEVDKTYHIRAYAKNIGAWQLGEEYIVTLQTPYFGDQTTIQSKTGTSISASLSSYYVHSGTGTISKVGFCYSSTNKEPTLKDSIVEATQTNGWYIGEIKGLTLGTTYYIRPYATSEYGTGYGKVIEVTTKGKPGEGDIDAPDKNN